MTHLEIKTFLYVSKDNAVPIELAQGLSLRSRGRAIGYIELIYGKQIFLGKAFGTDVFFWWAGVVQMLLRMVIRGELRQVELFPGPDGDVIWQRDGDVFSWSMSGPISFKLCLSVEKDVPNIYDQCTNFFKMIAAIDPDVVEDFSPVSKALSTLREHFYPSSISTD